jgi:hypothetical protein
MNNHKEFVELLLESLADPNIPNRVTGMPLLHATARSGNFELLETFLGVNIIDRSVKNNEDRTILHWLAIESERKPGDRHTAEYFLKLLLPSHYSPEVYTDDRDRSGNTVLCIAVERGFHDRAKQLLSKRSNVMVFEHVSEMLLSVILLILEHFLNYGAVSNGKPVSSMDFKLRLKYQLLTNIVLRMAKNQHLRASLRYLVISNFLSLKQQNIRSVFFYDLAFYVTLVPVLTLCILCSEYYNTLNDGGVPSNTIGPSSLKESYIMSGMNDSNSRSQPDSSILHILLCSLTVLLLIQTLRQMFQLIIFGQAYIAPVQTGLGILPIIDTFISY